MDKTMSLKDFDKLSKRDFENGAVINEIRESIKLYEQFKLERQSLYKLLVDELPKAKKDEYEYVCDETGGSCLYNEPIKGETCSMQDKNIPKSECYNYIKTIVYSAEEYNEARTDCITALKRVLIGGE